MKELEKYSLSDLFHIKDHLTSKINGYEVYEDDDYNHLNDKEKKEQKTLEIVRIEIKYEIEDRMKMIVENVEKEFFNY